MGGVFPKKTVLQQLKTVAGGCKMGIKLYAVAKNYLSAYNMQNSCATEVKYKKNINGII